MKIAIIGTGIAGNVAAYKLRQEHDITVFEADGYVGGHTHTIDVVEGDRSIPVDTGFIVFNEKTYPHFIELLDELGQRSHLTEMSFSVRAANDAIEYRSSTLNTIFAQRSNLLRPKFYRMLRDILRFNDAAPQDAERFGDAMPLGDYLVLNGYSKEFSEHYLVPMAAAIWSAEPVAVLDMPLSFLVRFFVNHGLMQLRDRPPWYVIEGGSREYVSKLVAGHRDRIRLNSPVLSVRRFSDRVELHSASGGHETFDCVFVACHSDQALRLLTDACPAERDVLGAIRYQKNEAILHTDASLMPRRRRAWAAWNYHLPEDQSGHVAVTYNMNILQRLDTHQQYCVTLNNDQQIDPRKIIRKIAYEHPIYSRDAVDAQARQAELNSARTYFCGAYWRNGFHEDGVVSALQAVTHFEEKLASGQLHLPRAS